MAAREQHVSDAFYEKLIELVKEKPYVFDPREKGYKDTVLVHQTWVAIAQKMGVEDGMFVFLCWYFCVFHVYFLVRLKSDCFAAFCNGAHQNKKARAVWFESDYAFPCFKLTKNSNIDFPLRNAFNLNCILFSTYILIVAECCRSIFICEISFKFFFFNE